MQCYCTRIDDNDNDNDNDSKRICLGGEKCDEISNSPPPPPSPPSSSSSTLPLVNVKKEIDSVESEVTSDNQPSNTQMELQECEKCPV